MKKITLILGFLAMVTVGGWIVSNRPPAGPEPKTSLARPAPAPDQEVRNPNVSHAAQVVKLAPRSPGRSKSAESEIVEWLRISAAAGSPTNKVAIWKALARSRDPRAIPVLWNAIHSDFKGRELSLREEAAILHIAIMGLGILAQDFEEARRLLHLGAQPATWLDPPYLHSNPIAARGQDLVIASMFLTAIGIIGTDEAYVDLVKRAADFENDPKLKSGLSTGVMEGLFQNGLIQRFGADYWIEHIFYKAPEDDLRREWMLSEEGDEWRRWKFAPHSPPKTTPPTRRWLAPWEE